MPETWTVLDVEEITDDSGTIPAWKLRLAVPERFDSSGEHHLIIPKAALEHRAAEYGYTTADEALEHLLYELVLAEPQSVGDQPMFAPAAMPAPQARAEAQRQIAWCKEEHAVIGPPAEPPATARKTRAKAATVDPLQVIRDNTTIDPIRTAALRMEIDRMRLTREAGRG